MPRRNLETEAAVRYLAEAQDGVIILRQAAACGMPPSTVIDRAARGRWRRLIPATYAVHAGPPTPQMLARAAMLYAGDDARLTGLPVLSGLPGVRTPSDPRVHVLIPATRSVTSRGFVLIERTDRLPIAVEGPFGLPAAPVARATVDAARRMKVARDVNALVTSVVQRGYATASELAEEARSAQRRGTRLLNAALRDALAGTHSVAESDARTALRGHGVPEPVWNPVLLDAATAAFLASPDGYYEDLGVALEVDSRAHHTIGDDFDRTLDRDALLTSYGILVIHATPASIRRDPAGYAARVRRTLEVAAGRPRPNVVMKRSNG